MGAAYPVTGLLAVLLAAAIFAAALGWGRLLLRGMTLAPGVAALAAIAVGTGVLAYTAFALGLLGALRAPALALVLGVGLLALAWTWPRPPARLAITVPKRGWLRWTVVAAALATASAALGALLPEIEYDALWYHLAFPARYLASGQLLDFPCEHMSPTPQHAELLYTYGLITGDARGAKFVHFGFGLLAAAWTVLLAGRVIGHRWALFAGALFLTVPTVMWEMTTAYNELPLAFYAAGAMFLLLEWVRQPRRSTLALAGLLLGLGLATKHLAAFFALPFAALVLLLPLNDAGRAVGTRVRDATLFCLIAITVALPWYVRAWYYTGNPLFPMFYGVLDRLGVPVSRWDAQAEAGWAAAMDRYGYGRDPLDLLLVPWRATWDGVAFAGSLGPAWLLLLPLLALYARRLDRALLASAAVSATYLLLWVTPFSSFQLRYLVPLVPLLAVLAAAAAKWLHATLRLAGLPRVRATLAGLLVFVLLTNLPPVQPIHDARTGWVPATSHAAKPAALLTALGLRDMDQYMRTRFEPYDAVRFINAELSSDARIVWFAEAADYYVVPHLLKDYSRCVSAGTWGEGPGGEARAHAALLAAGVSHVAWDLTRRDVRPEDFAVASPHFRSEFAHVIYEDDVVRLLELRPGR